MLKKFFLTLSIAAALFAGCKETESPGLTDYTRFVDYRIGTGGHGHVFVGANVPFGFVQAGPSSVPQEWDWTSGYHESDSTVIGFSHTHLSGTGIGDLHDISFMPVNGTVNYSRGNRTEVQSGIWSYSDRSREICNPGYYSTYLTRFGIQVELTATERAAMHRYTFDNADSAAVIIDLVNGGGWDMPKEGWLKVVNDSTIAGYRKSRGWAFDQRVYFTAVFSKPIVKAEYCRNGEILRPEDRNLDSTGRFIFGRFSFDMQEERTLSAKVGLSAVSIENAAENLHAETDGKNFECIQEEAKDKWNRELSKIRIETADSSIRKIFYTSLYHTMIAPSVFNDVNGEYYGADFQTHKMEDGKEFTNYTTFSCWDTYRAAHPLMTIIHPELTENVVNTMIQIYLQQGKLPVWHLMGCETNTMVGNPGVCILADALTKGYGKDRLTEGFDALVQSSMLDERGMKARKEYGYIPYDYMKESVAYDLEYDIADRAVAEVAQMIGDSVQYEYFLNRSQSYRHHFDKESAFSRGLCKDGRFRKPFNPYSSSHRDDDYCEGNAWQYTFLVPQDFNGLMDCFGSKERFISKLDSLFIAPSEIYGENASPDITGLIGQYAHGNEPSHHIIYFYTLAGKPERAAELLREVMFELYTDKPDGICGNEDVGQMSAWYILSSLGFYQVEPAGGRYVFGSPIVDRAEIRVKDGVFTVIATNNSRENKYIREVLLNGKKYDKNYIDFSEMKAGNTLEFVMYNGKE